VISYVSISRALQADLSEVRILHDLLAYFSGTVIAAGLRRPEMCPEYAGKVWALGFLRKGFTAEGAEDTEPKKEPRESLGRNMEHDITLVQPCQDIFT
jgi:hypothetical protein